jgi:hypothetical protein
LAVGCWLLANRPRILKRELPSGPRHPVQRLVPASRAHLSRTYHNIHEYYCSNNGKRPRNLQKLQNNDLFSVAYSSVIILYRDVQTP